MPTRKAGGWGRITPPAGTPIDWSNPITRGLVCRMIFTERANGSRYDSARGNVGVQSNNPPAATGPYGAAVAFDAPSSTKIRIAKAMVSALPVTMMCNIYNGASTANARAMCIADEATDNEWLLLFIDNATGKVNCTSTAAGVQATATGTADLRGKWHQIAAVFESTTSRKVYADGRLEGTNTTSNSPNFSTFDSIVLGALSRSTILYGSFVISNVSIWNRALSPAEIRWAFENPYGDFVTPRRRVSLTGKSGVNGRMLQVF